MHILHEDPGLGGGRGAAILLDTGSENVAALLGIRKWAFLLLTANASE